MLEVDRQVQLPNLYYLATIGTGIIFEAFMYRFLVIFQIILGLQRTSTNITDCQNETVGLSQMFSKGMFMFLPNNFNPQIYCSYANISHLYAAVAWREKNFKHFVFAKYFCLVLGLLKSRISKKSIEGLLRKSYFKPFHYKARVQPVS